MIRVPLVLLLLLLAAFLLCGLGCGETSSVAGAGAESVDLAPDAESSSAFGPVTEFSLTDQRGESTTLADLRGHPFVAAAIFTSCAGPCPKITGQMRRLQDELEGTDVRLVSVSVDPEFDTPERLRDYAETWGADGERWSFLTGDKEAIYELVQRGFWLAAQEDPEAPRGFHVTHKSSIVAVDRDGVRRGWYDGTDEKATDRLIERMRFLAQD